MREITLRSILKIINKDLEPFIFDKYDISKEVRFVLYLERDENTLTLQGIFLPDGNSFYESSTFIITPTCVFNPQYNLKLPF